VSTAAQVLSLESRVAEHQQQQASFDAQLQQSQLETQRAQRALRTAQQDAAGPAGPLDGALGGGLRGMPGLALRMQDQGSPGMLDTDSWAEPASVEVRMHTTILACLMLQQNHQFSQKFCMECLQCVEATSYLPLKATNSRAVLLC